MESFHKSLDISVLFTLRNSFIYEILYEVLEKTFPFGIPQNLIKFHNSVIFQKYEPIDDNSPKVLTLNDLGFGFVLWLGACGISIVGFMLEIFRIRVAEQLKSLIGLWVFLSIFRQTVWL